MTRETILYIPLAVFLTIGYWGGEDGVEKWQFAWRISSLLAVTAIYLSRKNLYSIDRIFLGVNIFLLVGGALSWLSIGEWLEVYGGTLRGVSLFVTLAVVGSVYTMFNARGFLNVERRSRASVQYSWILVAVALVAAGISWTYRGDRLLEGTIPFIMVYVASIVLKSAAIRSEKS